MDERSEVPIEKTGDVKKRYIFICSVVAAAVLLLTGWILLNRAPQNELERQIKDTQASITFSLYYPQRLPTGCTFDDQNGVTANGTLVTFKIACNDATMNITEQVRPVEIETVRKIVTLNSSLGQEYVANLDGHLVGFILTDQTLVIISPDQQLEDASPIQSLLIAFVRA